MYLNHSFPLSTLSPFLSATLKFWPPPSPPKPNIHSLVRLTDHTLWGLLYRAAHPSYTLLLPFPPQLSKSNPHPTPPPSKNRRLTDCDLLQTAAVTPLWDGPSMGSPAYQTPSDPPTSYDTRRRGHAWSGRQRTRKVCQSCPRRASPGMACTLKENKIITAIDVTEELKKIDYVLFKTNLTVCHFQKKLKKSQRFWTSTIHSDCVLKKWFRVSKSLVNLLYSNLPNILFIVYNMHPPLWATKFVKKSSLGVWYSLRLLTKMSW